MLEKILILVVLYSLFLAADWPNLKKQRKKERWYYIVLMLMTFYLATDYVLEANWPNLNKLIDFIFRSTTKQLIAYFNNSA